jgi:hypothetical protein
MLDQYRPNIAVDPHPLCMHISLCSMSFLPFLFLDQLSKIAKNTRIANLVVLWRKAISPQKMEEKKATLYITKITAIYIDIYSSQSLPKL